MQSTGFNFLGRFSYNFISLVVILGKFDFKNLFLVLALEKEKKAKKNL